MSDGKMCVPDVDFNMLILNRYGRIVDGMCSHTEDAKNKGCLLNFREGSLCV